MTSSTGVLLSAAIAVTLLSLAAAQDEKSQDRPDKTVAQWIESLRGQTYLKSADEAREALGPDGAFAKTAMPELIDALGDKAALVRSTVASTLADYGPPVVPALVAALKRPETRVRAGAAEALGSIRPKPVEAIPALLDLLKDKAPEARAAATGSLGEIGQSSNKTVPALVARLLDDDASVRQAAVQALSGFGEPAVPGLITALKDEDSNVRILATWSLMRIGPAAKAAVPALIESLQDKKNFRDRSTIAQTLGRIGPAAKEAVPALIDALGDSDEAHQRRAIDALGKIGPDAKAAVPELIKLAKDKHSKHRDTVFMALGEIGPEASAAVPILIDALGDKDSRVWIAKALGGIGSQAKDAVPALLAVARNHEGGLWEAEVAAVAVMRIDPALGAKEGMEFGYRVRLGKVPPVKLASRAAVTDEQKKRIKDLIAKLAEIKESDFGMSASFTGDAFAPLPDQGRWQAGLLMRHQTNTSDAFRSLVEIGPDALPFLLDSLDDPKPTKLKMKHNFGMGGMFLGNEIWGNPVNPVEKRALPKEASDEDDWFGNPYTRPYTLKVGDICFVAIGQIVGRPYRAVRYQPTAIIIVNSPLERKVLRDRVRAIWSSDDPAKMLLDSLLLDYATEGLFNGRSLDGWSEGSNLQVQSALRLLYYFPKETAPLIAARLRAMDVKDAGNDGFMKREVKNGVYTADFIKAVAWCKEPAIKEALDDIAKRSNDSQIQKSLSRNKK